MGRPMPPSTRLPAMEHTAFTLRVISRLSAQGQGHNFVILAAAVFYRVILATCERDELEVGLELPRVPKGAAFDEFALRELLVGFVPATVTVREMLNENPHENCSAHHCLVHKTIRRKVWLKLDAFEHSRFARQRLGLARNVFWRIGEKAPQKRFRGHPFRRFHEKRVLSVGAVDALTVRMLLSVLVCVASLVVVGIFVQSWQFDVTSVDRAKGGKIVLRNNCPGKRFMR